MSVVAGRGRCAEKHIKMFMCSSDLGFSCLGDLAVVLSSFSTFALSMTGLSFCKLTSGQNTHLPQAVRQSSQLLCYLGCWMGGGSCAANQIMEPMLLPFRSASHLLILLLSVPTLVL